ncbi:hypothetical protein [Helicobacter sp. T3_23-1059]
MSYLVFARNQSILKSKNANIDISVILLSQYDNAFLSLRAVLSGRGNLFMGFCQMCVLAFYSDRLLRF